MLHDLLLSCLSQVPNGDALKDFSETGVVESFLHPCEKEIFLDILKIVNVYNEVVRYTQGIGTDADDKSSEDTVINEVSDGMFGCLLIQLIHILFRLEPTRGFYLLNFGKGIESALDQYYEAIKRLEAYCFNTKPVSLSYVHNALLSKQPTLLLLRKFIRDVEAGKLHGCALLNYLYQQSDHGDFELEIAARKVLKPVKMAFFSSMAHWMLFGVIDDVHSEFFIKFTPLENNSSACNKSSNSSILHADKNGEDYIWQYEVNHNQLPGFVSSVVAEKILFVGQTVLVFQMERNFQSKKETDQLSVCLSDLCRDDIYELWNGREGEYFRLIEDLSLEPRINPFHIEDTVNLIKKYVSQRLSEIAINEVDLVRQLGLIKDFYLLGRGEFYLEFLTQLNGPFDCNLIKTNKNYPRSFEIAATVMGMADDIENFTLSYLKANADPDESFDFHVFQCLHLKFTFQWPLNLLFSPKAIERYNTIFRYLLIIRNLQFEMQRAWAKQTCLARHEPADVHIKAMNLRNHLMFFLNNMQYYIQVDVLESQYGILMNVIEGKADFEEIQRAHTVFLANVLSQCFLISDSKEGHMNMTGTISQSQNPIYGTILKLFSICETFTTLSRTSLKEVFLEDIDSLEEQFGVQIASLIQLLVDAKTASTLNPLSQLLLRLDFNHWFSQKQKEVVSLEL
ncbi:gamma-tubulin complex component 4 homolog isoform X1 [Drosophila bipectinata]|uniref:gamma-tubulin complex component 4 homolog isoform X1 n=1 Tax=Drosophila bipectinata TaxID=42026 RepID=UPI0038B24038